MSLKQQLVEDMKAAMKSGDKHTLGVVRLINAQSREKHGGVTVFSSALTCFR